MAGWRIIRVSMSEWMLVPAAEVVGSYTTTSSNSQTIFADFDNRPAS